MGGGSFGGTPKIHKVGKNVACMRTNTPRFSSKQLPRPHTLSEILYLPLYPGVFEQWPCYIMFALQFMLISVHALLILTMILYGNDLKKNKKEYMCLICQSVCL